MTPVEQLAPAARVAPQLFCTRLKGGVTVRVSELAVEPPELVSLPSVTGWTDRERRWEREAAPIHVEPGRDSPRGGAGSRGTPAVE